MPLLEINNLSFSYKTGRKITPVLENVSLPICKNEITAIYGASGSGKSTLLNILSLLYKELEDCDISGEVVYNGKNILSLKKDFWKVRRNIIYIAQTPNPFDTSIWKNMVFPLKINGIKDKVEIEEKVTQALKDVNLYDEVKDRLDHPANELSGGQKQKLCFARALVLKPDVLLMDEPTSSLDSENKVIIEDLIKQLGINNTIVFVSHDLDQIERIADRVFKCENRTLLPCSEIKTP